MYVYVFMCMCVYICEFVCDCMCVLKVERGTTKRKEERRRGKGAVEHTCMQAEVGPFGRQEGWQREGVKAMGKGMNPNKLMCIKKSE